jgi:hypothetical protein
MPETTQINSADKHYYRLRVNINGFNLDQIRVSLVDESVGEKSNNSTSSTNEDINGIKSSSNKAKIKISAHCDRAKNNSTNTESEESSQHYVKYYDIMAKSNLDLDSMRYYLDAKNSLYLIVEFVSNLNENVYINLDDSCESLVEMAAKSLLNVRNIDELRYAIENPYDPKVESNYNSLNELFSPSIIRDLTNATKTTFTPINIVDKPNNTKAVSIRLNIPYSIKSVSLLNGASKTITNNNPELIEERTNHLTIKCDNLNLHLQANAANESTTSLFTKQFRLPKGTITKDLTYSIDQNKHSLTIEAPFIA